MEKAGETKKGQPMTHDDQLGADTTNEVERNRAALGKLEIKILQPGPLRRDTQMDVTALSFSGRAEMLAATGPPRAPEAWRTEWERARAESS